MFLFSCYVMNTVIGGNNCGRRKVTGVVVLCRRHEASHEKPHGADPELSPGLRGERRTGWS
jgi:hypothetical protein